MSGGARALKSRKLDRDLNINAVVPASVGLPHNINIQLIFKGINMTKSEKAIYLQDNKFNTLTIGWPGSFLFQPGHPLPKENHATIKQ